ncbi:MAG: helix-hairpin-helix domain-containing protein [Calditrichaeota bacterium]|nr:helix-hairpin-helix domain-containing protein [Calditrichota bacterium]
MLYFLTISLLVGGALNGLRKRALQNAPVDPSVAQLLRDVRAAVSSRTSDAERSSAPAREEGHNLYRFDLNRAGVEELQRLPRVGPVMARRIVQYRDRVGRFTSVEQLLEVKGIGRKTLERLRPYVYVAQGREP